MDPHTSALHEPTHMKIRSPNFRWPAERPVRVAVGPIGIITYMTITQTELTAQTSWYGTINAFAT